jgi:adenylylsulfate kinase-like enzyme
MSGAGKTVIGKELYNRIKLKHLNTVFIDGDVFRDIMGSDIVHTVEDRKKNADRICRFCKYLDSQNIHVVASVLSIFHESQVWNRENYKRYYEVYLEVSEKTLFKRDTKGLYKAALSGKIKNVVGVDLEFPQPINPDLTIVNEGKLSVKEVADLIYSEIPPLTT